MKKNKEKIDGVLTLVGGKSQYVKRDFQAEADHWQGKRQSAGIQMLEHRQSEQAAFETLQQAIEGKTSKADIRQAMKMFSFWRGVMRDHEQSRATAADSYALYTGNALRPDATAKREFSKERAGNTKKNLFKPDGTHTRATLNKDGQTVDVCRDDYIRLVKINKRGAAGIAGRKHGFTAGCVREAAKRLNWMPD
jgi:hypothetical protein